MSSQNKWYNITAPQAADGTQSNTAEIYIYDDIGLYGVSGNEFVDELNRLGPVDTINVRISSGGGDIVEGNKIYSALKRHQAKVVTHIDSLAASMASVIAMAGDEIRMAENAMLMIHNPLTVSWGNADQLRKTAGDLDKYADMIRNSYARTNYTSDELQKLMDAETYFTAAEALEAGFVDYIDGAQMIAASIGDMATLKHFKNVPTAALAQIKIDCQAKQLDKQTAKIEALNDELDTLRAEHEVAGQQLANAAASMLALKAEHAEALKTATAQTQADIAAKAAELMAQSGHTAMTVEPTADPMTASSQKMTEADFWEQYKALGARGDHEGKNQFYAEHKHVIGQ